MPPENLLGNEEGNGFVQLMQQLPQERLSLAIGAVASMERAVKLTADYTKERTAFGKPLIEFQNTAFKLAERKTEAVIARVFVDWCVERLVAGDLDTVTASMAKWWCSQKQVETADECLQLHGGYGYMQEYPISRMFIDARIQKIYGGTNEIMKVLIARSLSVPAQKITCLNLLIGLALSVRSQAEPSSTTPTTRVRHPAMLHALTGSRRISIPNMAPTIIDISRAGATRLSGAPISIAVRTRM